MSPSAYQSNGKPLSQEALYKQKLKQGGYQVNQKASNVGSNGFETSHSHDKSDIPSVYKTEGTLSDAAIYQMKKKHGIYNQPGKTTLGVGSNTSDADVSFITTETISVYKTDDVELSEAAIYQRKLKYGVYHQPGKKTVGVGSNASDIAASFVTTDNTSVYKTDDVQLSEAAIYQRKLKYGFFEKPDKPSVGVNSNASDTAALLAASSDLNVKPIYERVANPDAQTAATASQFVNKRTYTTKHDVHSLTHPESHNAANAIYANPITNYAYHDIRADHPHISTQVNMAGIHSISQTNASYSMTTRTDPELDYRSGLPTNSSKTGLNMGKIHSLANSNSTRTMDSRLNPSLDYRSGLPTEFLTNDEENFAADGAAASLNKPHTSASSSKSKSSRSFVAADIVNQQLMDKANARANERLKTITSDVVTNYKEQAKLYAGALLIAQQNSQLRQQSYGKIDLGGGLTMTPQELHAMATRIVKPVLNDMDNKAAAQREIDYHAALEKEELKKKHGEHKAFIIEEKQRVKNEKLQAKQDRKLDHENLKQEELNKLNEFQTSKDQEVEAENQKVREQEELHESQKNELLEAKRLEEERITGEEGVLVTGRQSELAEVEASKKEVIQPTLDELEIETKKLDELVEEKIKITSSVAEEQAKNDELTAKLAQLTESSKETETKIEEANVHLNDLTTKEAEAENTFNTLSGDSDAKYANLTTEEESYDAKIKELEASKLESLKLKEAKKNEIDAQVKEKLKDEHRINNELPDHLKKNINESKILDTSDVFSLDDSAKKAAVPKKVESKSIPKVEEKKTDPIQSVSTPKPESSKTSKSPEKKKGFRNRLSKIFLNSEPKPKGNVVVPQKAEPKSVDDHEDFDDFSINEGQNQGGGLFKEEI